MPQRSRREIALDGLRFIVHLTVSAIGVPIAASVLRYSIVVPLHEVFPLVSLRTGHWILLQTPYFPVQIVIGLLWGFQLSRRYRHVAMLWTWSVPAMAIVLLVLFAPLRPVVVSGIEITGFSRFFGWSCLPRITVLNRWLLRCCSTGLRILGSVACRISSISSTAIPRHFSTRS